MSDNPVLTKTSKKIGLGTLVSAVRLLSWIATIGILALLVTEYVVGRTNAAPPPELPSTPLPIGDWTLGRPTAPVALIAYMDFQCPFCRRFHQETLPALRDKYVGTGLVFLTFRQMPSPAHQRAMPAAVAAACAGQQGHFWEMADRLYASSDLSDDIVHRYVGEIGLQEAVFNSCISAPEARDTITRDLATASALSVHGTPYFVVGLKQPNGIQAKQIIVGSKDTSEFISALDAALRSTR